MRFSLSALALTAYIYGTAAAKCNANNCARAVTGTRLGPQDVAMKSADCMSAIDVTVTPDATTLFETVTVSATLTTQTFGTSTNWIQAKRSAATEPVVPPYASPCPDYAAYSSACSCWGLQPQTHTAPTPSTTVTVTETQPLTATVPVVATATCSASGQSCYVSNFSMAPDWRAACGGGTCVCDVKPGAGSRGTCSPNCIAPGNWCGTAEVCKTGLCCNGYTGRFGSYCDRV